MRINSCWFNMQLLYLKSCYTVIYRNQQVPPSAITFVSQRHVSVAFFLSVVNRLPGFLCTKFVYSNDHIFQYRVLNFRVTVVVLKTCATTSHTKRRNGNKGSNLDFRFSLFFLYSAQNIDRSLHYVQLFCFVFVFSITVVVLVNKESRTRLNWICFFLCVRRAENDK